MRFPDRQAPVERFSLTQPVNADSIKGHSDKSFLDPILCLFLLCLASQISCEFLIHVPIVRRSIDDNEAK